VDARREPKKPLMNVYLLPEYAKDDAVIKRVAEEIEEVSLGKVAEVAEDLSQRVIFVKPDQKMLEYEGLTAEDVFKRVKSQELGKIEQAPDGKITVTPKATSLKSIRRASEKMRDLHLKGVKGISKAIVITENGERLIRTAGSNVAEMLKIKEVDGSRIYTNNIKEVGETLGIEAARNSIIFEAKQVLDMQKLDVDVRHLSLLADAMCMDGQIKSVGRHGLSGEKASILARAAFEETIKHLINAAITGEEDKLVGVTENIIVGQNVPVGTGIVKLSMARKK
jgi:DNA-directed RNA polymerase subunit A"